MPGRRATLIGQKHAARHGRARPRLAAVLEIWEESKHGPRIKPASTPFPRRRTSIRLSVRGRTGMLLSSHHHSAEKFSPTIESGLRSLLVPPSGGVVVTRAIAAASRGCGGEAGVQEISIDHKEEMTAKAEEEEEDVIEADEEDEGCWVSYGRREPRRRLPPPIPSLLARGALMRTRTHDGRLVIRIAPVVWRECIRARRRCGRLTMQLVEHHHDDFPFTPRSAREYDTRPTIIGEGVDDNTAIGSAAAVAQDMLLPLVPPPRVPSAGCFEDVFKYGSSISLHQMPSLRMVH